MKIRIFVGYPPEREAPTAEFSVPNERGGVDVPALITREQGRLVIEIYGREGGPAHWKLPLGSFLEAVGAAVAGLDDPPRIGPMSN